MTQYVAGKPMLLYIASDVRSGSTLLDMLLGGHSQIEALGELQFLKSHVRREGTGYSWDWKCTCGTDFKDCQYWSEIDQRIRLETGLSLADTETWVRERKQFFPLLLLPAPIIRFLEKRIVSIRHGSEVAVNCWRIVDATARKTGKPFVVDSSKNAEQFRYLYMLRPRDIRLIHLVRDGRGVIYSKMSRAGDTSRKAVKNWLIENIKILCISLMVPSTQKMLLRYEDLCADPQHEIGRILGFLGLSSEELKLSKQGRHNVCGSPHRFDYGDLEIKIDKRWEAGLSSGDKRTFNVFGGWLNWLLGYR